MKRFLVPAILAVALVLPAQAVAKKPKHYTGTVTPAGTIGFKVVQKRHSKEKRVASFRFSGVPVTCAAGANTTFGVVSTPVKLKKGKFNIVALNNITGAKLEIHGNLKRGTLRVSGNVPIEPGGQGTSCDSGVLGWTAHRG
ncbi:MAG TPA: hypothetical protein VIZ61_11520 [Solirubrobacterales bacterium]